MTSKEVWATLDRDELIEIQIGLQASSRLHLNLQRNREINQRLQNEITEAIVGRMN